MLTCMDESDESRVDDRGTFVLPPDGLTPEVKVKQERLNGVLRGRLLNGCKGVRSDTPGCQVLLSTGTAPNSVLQFTGSGVTEGS